MAHVRQELAFGSIGTLCGILGLLQIVGVHLKAMPDKSDVRREQVQMISDYLADRQDEEPAIVVGDFNAYGDDAFLTIPARGDKIIYSTQGGNARLL